MFIYRLALPIDEFDDLMPLPGWLRDRSPESVAWQLRTVLALADAALQVGWRGDMRHLPSVGHTGASPYLAVRQDDDGATFVISETTLPWACVQATARAHTAGRPIGSWTHPTDQDIAEATAEAQADSVRQRGHSEPDF
jgi:hypothetical protein